VGQASHVKFKKRFLVSRPTLQDRNIAKRSLRLGLSRKNRGDFLLERHRVRASTMQMNLPPSLNLVCNRRPSLIGAAALVFLLPFSVARGQLPSEVFANSAYADGNSVSNLESGSFSVVSPSTQYYGSSSSSVSDSSGTLRLAASFSGNSQSENTFYASPIIEEYFQVFGGSAATTIPVTISGHYSGIANRSGAMSSSFVMSNENATYPNNSPYTLGFGYSGGQSFSKTFNVPLLPAAGGDLYQLLLLSDVFSSGAGVGNASFTVDASITIDPSVLSDNPGLTIETTPGIEISAIPEPSTGASILGAVALGFVIIRRKRGLALN
jgi:hypothetical protein